MNLNLGIEPIHTDDGRLILWLRAAVVSEEGRIVAQRPILKWGGPDTQESLAQGTEELVGRFAGFLQAQLMRDFSEIKTWGGETVKHIPDRPPERLPRPEPENPRFAKAEVRNDKDSILVRMLAEVTRREMAHTLDPAEIVTACAQVAEEFLNETTMQREGTALRFPNDRLAGNLLPITVEFEDGDVWAGKARFLLYGEKGADGVTMRIEEWTDKDVSNDKVADEDVLTAVVGFENGERHEGIIDFLQIEKWKRSPLLPKGVLDFAALKSALDTLDIIQTQESGENIVRVRRVAPAVLNDDEAHALRVARGMA